ncbi:hypothetical protein IFM58399_06030 [Aspergillus lentulus]|uniref:NF-kappa-B inhibitor-like protein 1 n=1 Tax=Aspergillus lentulus TaxID=293939 RepID=A0AAN5YPJ0_ASPLE|nr:uncharacterized protein IFM58399_06030 [Aspergillus lentulus]KAF4157875.1 hypothetical protein CNMCM6069_004958 [Aspergillus lentulus]KAF4173289.1 hypothetical protein CNMCM8060_000263 [Aspergillus lentulus]KAF4198054.1 hypothetical protein CNMCM8694_001245 [Aspergillus lentulus]KAF4205458.1 hypothetical protein CNMCM8927_006206 [Aspergillus lentulus]GFF40750.1 hypothetical protein IFM58399_06030 [Aspergillus lentulus]
MDTASAAENGPEPHESPEARSAGNEYTRPAAGKFRFKSSKSTKSKSHRDEPYDTHHHHHHRRRHHHSHHHDHHRSSKRHKSKRSPSPNPRDQGNPSRLSPDTAFRESLFDALGDDEGAAYWETVYGQPIHRYPVPSVPKGPDGELEQMSEEEYAAYVRSRMWARTREGMLEEQERLRAERARQKRREEESAESQRERMRFEQAMEESLQRGRERRRLKVWKTAWDEYRRAWEEVNREVNVGEGERRPFRNLVFWPVESGKRRDVSREAVEEFMRHAPVEASGMADSDGADGMAGLLAVLKSERIRWHPDKIQHRYGALGIDENVLASVTEVFQIIDHMWNETRARQ